jgi:hypothetical protein
MLAESRCQHMSVLCGRARLLCFYASDCSMACVPALGIQLPSGHQDEAGLTVACQVAALLMPTQQLPGQWPLPAHLCVAR